jgi:hypothetical protein
MDVQPIICSILRSILRCWDLQILSRVRERITIRYDSASPIASWSSAYVSSNGLEITMDRILPDQEDQDWLRDWYFQNVNNSTIEFDWYFQHVGTRLIEV